MMRQTLALLSLVVALSVAGFVLAEVMPGMPGMHAESNPAAPPATSSVPAAHMAVDLGNTVCPVSGDKVSDSKVVEVYDGKIYHLCCGDCPKEFEKDPAKFVQLVAADPAKYGIAK